MQLRKSPEVAEPQEGTRTLFLPQLSTRSL